ncbi:MAG: PQQ-dependent sugar dehydrogenase [Cellvibrio sp.]|nr:PQQ-dependent sugar dehydrogenase [Cellvibrio sp.]
MKIFHLGLLSLGLLATVCVADTDVKTERYEITIKPVATGLQNPWGLTQLPDGNFLVTERTGTMRIVSAAGKIGEPISGLPTIEVKGQGGLLDVTLAPDFSTSQKIYFSYTEPANGGNSTAVSYGVLKNNRLENVTRVFSQQPKVDSSAHFGSRLIWRKDGTLFITLGDRYERKDEAQTLNTHHGKVVRINADGSVPKDNPFVNTPNALPEIWSYGHRNMQGGAINPTTGELWSGEHGPQGGDEINIDRAGKNYGWPVITYGENYGGGKIGDGITSKSGMEQPLHYWVPSIATAGFIFYTGSQFPEWNNNIILGALNGKTLVRLVTDGDKIIHEERLFSKELDQRIRSVAQATDGTIYFITDDPKGSLYRITRKP